MDDQAETKLIIWKTGLDLAHAEILVKEKKYILAKYYANGVISMPDSKNILVSRKKEAKKSYNRYNTNSVSFTKCVHII